MNRFVLVIEGETKEVVNDLVAYFKEKGVGYWHHLDNMWLIVDKGSKITPANIRDKTTEISGGKSCFVTRVPNGESSDWAIRANKASFEWLHKNWTIKNQPK